MSIDGRGYLAPEYAMHGHLSEKVDVYSYGIVILEIICGRKCLDNSLPQEEKSLKFWVCPDVLSLFKTTFDDISMYKT